MFTENVKWLQRRQLAFSHTATPEMSYFFSEYTIVLLVCVCVCRICETVGDTVYIYWSHYCEPRRRRVALNQNCLFFPFWHFILIMFTSPLQVPHHFHIYCKTRRRGGGSRGSGGGGGMGKS